MWAGDFIEAIIVGQKNAIIASRFVYRRDPLHLTQNEHFLGFFHSISSTIVAYISYGFTESQWKRERKGIDNIVYIFENPHFQSKFK